MESASMIEEQPSSFSEIIEYLKQPKFMTSIYFDKIPESHYENIILEYKKIIYSKEIQLTSPEEVEDGREVQYLCLNCGKNLLCHIV